MADTTITHELTDEGFFAGLEPAYIERLAEYAQRETFKKDRTLFRVGDRADRFYLLSEGEVSIEIAALEGPPLQLQSLGAGRILGWSWLIPPYRWNFQCRAEIDCRVITLDGVAVLAYCEQDPRFGYELLKRFSTLMSRRLAEARTRMMEEWNPAGFA